MTAGQSKSTIDQLMASARTHLSAGEYDAAEWICTQLIEKSDAAGEAHRMLGLVYEGQGRVVEAIDAFRKALESEPKHVETLANLGNVLHRTGALDDASKVYRRVLVLQPDNSEVKLSLAATLDAMGDIKEAAELCRAVHRAEPDNSRALIALGQYLSKRGKLDDAVAFLENAIEIEAKDSPNLTHAYSQLAAILETQNELEDALANYDKAIALKSDFAEARAGRGRLLLRKGDYKRGWMDHEWRFRIEAAGAHNGGTAFDQPRWQGESLSGKVVFVEPEGDLCDTILFVRYVPLLVNQAKHVIFECRPEMWRLLSSLLGNHVELRIKGENPTHPSFDLYCPLLSLPAYLGVTPERMLTPADSYLTADVSLAAAWDDRLQPAPVKVGVIWDDGTAARQESGPPLRLAALAPLLSNSGVSWISLQNDPAAREALSQLPRAHAPQDFGNLLSDYADNAALITRLDLVIGGDTPAVHLAGALGRPVWTLLSYVPHWRWMAEGDRTPWYSSMRLFRQDKPGDWAGVVNNVGEALAARAQGGA